MFMEASTPLGTKLVVVVGDFEKCIKIIFLILILIFDNRLLKLST